MAKNILEKIRRKRGAMVQGMETLCDAYITLAYMDVNRFKNEKSESECISVYFTCGGLAGGL